MSIVFYNSSPPNKNIDFDSISNYILKKEDKIVFISDWNSSNSISYIDDIYYRSFEKSLNSIDYYHSSENNKCQEAINKYLYNHYNISLSEKQIICGNNATSLICFSLLLLSNLGVKNYLGFSPMYYSFIDIIKICHSNMVIYQTSDYDIDISICKIEKVIQKHHIQAIVITEPVFCFGKKISNKMINKIVSLANKYDCYLIADLTREGLDWSNDNDELLIDKTIVSLHRANRFFIFYSPCKKVFANGVKTAILITSNDKLDYFNSFQDSFIGSISSIQIEFLNLLFSNKYNNYIFQKIRDNRKTIISNYEMINSVLPGCTTSLIRPDAGCFTVAKIDKKSYDDKHIFELLYNKLGILTLPLSLYNYFEENNYLFRINLSLNRKLLINTSIKLMDLEKYF